MRPSAIALARACEHLLAARSRLTRRSFSEPVFLGATLLVVAVYSLSFFDRGWIPHDEGTIAQGAERVLAGELPHRDFEEGYTGALTYAHALAFRLLGTRLVSLRYLLFVSFLLFVAALFRLARRFASLEGATLLTFCGAAWSVPNYFASLPSWYNLFFATWGALAVFRHVEDGRRRWLFLAGASAGLSVVVKIVGLYDLLALLLYVAYWEQTQAAADARDRPRRDLGFRLFQAASVLALMAILGVVFARPPFAERRLLQFVIPPSVLSLLLLIEGRRAGGRSRERFTRLATSTAPLLAGFLLPVAVFLVPFAVAGALPALARGVFLLPRRQIETAAAAPDPIDGMWLALLLLVTLLLPRELLPAFRRLLAAALALFASALLLMSGDPLGYQLLWSAARGLGVLIPVAIAVFLAIRRAGELADAARLRLFLLAALTALVALVQYPFSRPVYFCYVAPVAVLAAAALATARRGTPRASAVIVLLLFLVFALVRMNPGYVFRLGRIPGRYEADGLLSLARGRLRVPTEEAREYENLVRAIRSHIPRGEIYASPDCPEVYFLAGRRNPTRYFFDFLSDADRDAEKTLRLLESQKIQGVVLNDGPHFSRRPTPAIRREIARRYPCSESIGRFTLFWKGAACRAGTYEPGP